MWTVGKASLSRRGCSSGLACAFLVLASGIGGPGLQLLVAPLIESVSTSSHEYSFHT